MLLSLAFLVACSTPANQGDKAVPDDSGTTDTLGPNPIVPEAYALLWDLDASSCEDDDDAIVYHLFSGATDGAGGFSGTEGYYWFYKTEGWDGDCVDAFEVSGEASDTNWQSDPCSGCDYEYTSEWQLQDAGRGCSGLDYEDFFANDDVARDRYNTIVMLDPLSPGGNVNETTLVMMAYQDDDDTNSYSFDSAYGRGSMTPAVEGAFDGPATVEWVGSTGWCVKITGNG